jgi:hypothetical protein
MAPRKKVGRPPKPPGEKFVVAGLRLPPAELARIDIMVHAGRTRNDVLRELLAEALAARAKAESWRGKVGR